MRVIEALPQDQRLHRRRRRIFAVAASKGMLVWTDIWRRLTAGDLTAHYTDLVRCAMASVARGCPGIMPSAHVIQGVLPRKDLLRVTNYIYFSVYMLSGHWLFVSAVMVVHLAFAAMLIVGCERAVVETRIANRSMACVWL